MMLLLGTLYSLPQFNLVRFFISKRDMENQDLVQDTNKLSENEQNNQINSLNIVDF